MRNWYYFTWLSGDFNVEQHVHSLDVCAWVMKDEYPVKAIGMGGRQVRTGPEYGHIFDHFSVVYEYANGVRLFSNCRQQPGCKNDMSAHVARHRRAGPSCPSAQGRLEDPRRGGEWAYDGPKNADVPERARRAVRQHPRAASRSTTATTWPRAR